MYKNELEQCLVRALDKARTTKLMPKESRYFDINEEYRLKVYCYAGFVRKFTIRDKYNDCVASSWTEEWILYSFLEY